MTKNLNKGIISSEEKNLRFWNGIIEKVKPNDRIQKLVAFSTWWNKDLAIIINNQYQVNLLIYENSWGNVPERLKISFIGNYSSLEEAETKAKEAIDKLNGDIPILYKYSSIELKYVENYFFPETELTELSLPNSDVENFPDKYIKPFDIVRIHGGSYFHSGIYLGNGKVCHVLLNREITQAVVKEETGADASSYDYDDHEIIRGDSNGMIGITNWKNFLKFMGSNPNKVSYLHSFVPYKRWEWIAEDIAKSIEGASAYFSEDKRGKYSAKMIEKKADSNNCEHYANGIIHGMFISNYGEKYKIDKKVLINGKPIGRRIKKLTNVKKIIENNRKFFQGLVSNEEKVKSMINLVNNECAISASQCLENYKASIKFCDKSLKCKL